MEWKPVLIPELSYQAIKAYAKAHNMKINKVMQKMLFTFTMSFWSDPENYGVIIEKKESPNEQQTNTNSFNNHSSNSSNNSNDGPKDQ